MAAAGVAGAGGAGLLGRAAAHQRRHLRRLLRLAGRLGTVPRRAVRHPSPLRHRAEPEGGQRSRGAPSVLDVLPRYLEKDGVVAVGEIGLRLHDAARRTRCSPRSWPSRSSTRCRRSCTPRTGTSSAASNGAWPWSRESGIDPGRVVIDHLNEVTVAGGRGHRVLDGLLDLPGHQDVAAADGRDPAEGVRRRADAGELGRGLGPLRSSADRADRRGDAGRRVRRRRRRPGAVAQPGGVLRPVRPAGTVRRWTRRRRHFAGNSILRGGS